MLNKANLNHLGHQDSFSQPQKHNENSMQTLLNDKIKESRWLSPQFFMQLNNKGNKTNIMLNGIFEIDMQLESCPVDLASKRYRLSRPEVDTLEG